MISKEPNDEPKYFSGRVVLKSVTVTDRKVSEFVSVRREKRFPISIQREDLQAGDFLPLILIWRYWIDPLQRSPPLSHRIKLHRQELSLFRSAQSHGRAGTPFVQTALS